MKKHILGRKAELFVIGTLYDRGWKINTNINDVDVAMEKDGRVIQIEIKGSQINRPNLHKGNSGFDYLLYTDLKDIYVIPKELINKSCNRLNPTLKKLKNRFELLELEKLQLLTAINDCGIHFGDLDNTNEFFK